MYKHRVPDVDREQEVVLMYIYCTYSNVVHSKHKVIRPKRRGLNVVFKERFRMRRIIISSYKKNNFVLEAVPPEKGTQYMNRGVQNIQHFL
jgi:hypothetical protein